MRGKYIKYGLLTTNSFIIILLFLLYKIDYAILYSYDSDYSITENSLGNKMILINMISAIIFFVLIWLPDRRIINHMKFWNLYLILIAINAYIRYFIPSVISLATHIWMGLAHSTTARELLLFSQHYNSLYTQILFVLILFYLVFAVLLHFYISQIEDRFNRYAYLISGLIDKLILVFLIIYTIIPSMLEILAIKIDLFQYPYLVFGYITSSILIIVGILGFRIIYTDNHSLNIRQETVNKLIFIGTFNVFFVFLIFLDLLSSDSDRFDTAYFLSLFLNSTLLMAIGGTIDLLIRYKFKKIIRSISKIFTLLKIYIVIISILGIMLYAPVIVQSSPNQFGSIFLDVTSVNNYTLDTELYFDSNNIFFEQIRSVFEFNLTFSALMTFSMTQNGFQRENIINITSVRYNSITTAISSNFTLLFDLNTVYQLQLTTNQIIPKTHFVGLAMYRILHNEVTYSMVAAFPEMIEVITR